MEEDDEKAAQALRMLFVAIRFFSPTILTVLASEEATDSDAALLNYRNIIDFMQAYKENNNTDCTTDLSSNNELIILLEICEATLSAPLSLSSTNNNSTYLWNILREMLSVLSHKDNILFFQYWKTCKYIYLCWYDLNICSLPNDLIAQYISFSVSMYEFILKSDFIFDIPIIEITSLVCPVINTVLICSNDSRLLCLSWCLVFAALFSDGEVMRQWVSQWKPHVCYEVIIGDCKGSNYENMLLDRWPESNFIFFGNENISGLDWLLRSILLFDTWGLALPEKNRKSIELFLFGNIVILFAPPSNSITWPLQQEELFNVGVLINNVFQFNMTEIDDMYILNHGIRIDDVAMAFYELLVESLLHNHTYCIISCVNFLIFLKEILPFTIVRNIFNEIKNEIYFYIDAYICRDHSTESFSHLDTLCYSHEDVDVYILLKELLECIT